MVPMPSPRDNLKWFMSYVYFGFYKKPDFLTNRFLNSIYSLFMSLYQGRAKTEKKSNIFFQNLIPVSYT